MEGLFQQFDGYCERTDFTYWSEPVNALTNAAFLIAAFVMWRRVRGQNMPLANMLCVALALIGIGSYLFHTYATGWASIADVAPIGLFILLYVFAASRAYWNLSPVLALAATTAIVPIAMLLTPVFLLIPFFAISAAYWPVLLLIAVFAVGLRNRSPETSRGLALGASVLVLSLGFRSVDGLFCASFPTGTHFLWHLLNGVMLGWMIEVYRRHILASRLAEGAKS